MRRLGIVTVAAIVLGLGQSCWAIDVTVKGLHLCCGGCNSAVEDAINEVKGVSAVTSDANTKVVAFKAPDEKVMQAAFDAMAKAGFHGDAFADKKAVKFPSVEVKKGTKTNRLTATGLHLCCGACKTGVQKALSDVPAVTEISIDQEARSVTVVGKDIDVEGVFKALNKAGYHAELKKDEKVK